MIEKYIDKTVSSLLEQKTKYKIELIIVDGKSTDKTLEVLSNFQNKNIKIFNNENRTAPYALNIGIANSSGRYIMRADAHANYSEQFVESIISYLEKHPEITCAGCPLITIPANNSLKARAISEAFSSKFGVCSSNFRLGVSEPKQVDTLAFGAYRKEVFQECGTFDTQLTRNQDDEFNARIIKTGHKIVLLPSPTNEYYARDNLKKVWRMFYQYGLFKPIVNRKLGQFTTLRQLAPPILVIGNLISLIPYLIFLLFAFVSKAKEGKGLSQSFYFVITIVVMHYSYGLGYLKSVVLGTKVTNQNLKISR